MDKISLWQKQKDISYNKTSPLFRFLVNIETFSPDTKDKSFIEIKEELKLYGYTKLSFIKLRNLVINDDLTYNLSKIASLVDTIIPEEAKDNRIYSIAETEKNTNWLYYQNMIEYVNIRSLGLNDKNNKLIRPGNFLDLIIYLLQTRSSVLQFAPFHNCSFDQLYSAKDTYSILKDLIAPELLTSFSAEEQLKIALDLGHIRKEKNAFLIDTLPHTTELSVNYLYKPDQARWLMLNETNINNNKKLFRKGLKIINQIKNNNHENINETDINEIFNLTINQFNELLINNISTKENNIIENKLKKLLVINTGIINNKSDIDYLKREAKKKWINNKNAENKNLIDSKNAPKICSRIKEIVKNKLGPNFSYEDLQNNEYSYATSINKLFREQHYVYNLPVGSWDGGEPELVGFHINYNYPVFLCKSFYSISDTSKNMFGTISRRQFRFSDGNINESAVNEFINAYHYWLMLGFDGLRMDQVNHLFHKQFDYLPDSKETLEEYFIKNHHPYDTILAQDLKTFIKTLKEKTNLNLQVMLEDMMHYPITASNILFKELENLDANTIIGNLQFMDKMPKLLFFIQTHNLIKLYQQTDRYMLNTIECHDNNLALGGTSPVCKDGDGILTARIRFLLNCIGLPHISTQALHAINSEKNKNAQMQDSINSIQNLNFKNETYYYLDNNKLSFDDFRHNLFDFIETPEIKTILKGGIIQIHNNNKITENSENGLLFLTVHNKSPYYIFLALNASDKTYKDVWLNNTNLDWYSGNRNVLSFELDKHYNQKLHPNKSHLTMINENGKKHAINFGHMPAGEIRIYLVI